MTEQQITFEKYSKLIQKLNSIENTYESYCRKYYDLNKEKDRHIKDLQSEIRHLRRLINIAHKEY